MILHFLNLSGGLQFLNLRKPKSNAPSSKRIPTSSSASSIRCDSELAGNGLPGHGVAGVLHNKVLVSAVVSAAVGQMVKPFASSILYGEKFDLKTCLKSGGFPSTHSSSVVATATCLAIERGFSDALFGLAVVYAGLIMYDSQGVRREVGNHARVLNKAIPSTISYSSSSADGLVNSNHSRESSWDSEISDPESLATSRLLLEPEQIISSGVAVSGSESVAWSSLKESIGHTEVEVAAGALLGLVVSLVICPYL